MFRYPLHRAAWPELTAIDPVIDPDYEPRVKRGFFLPL